MEAAATESAPHARKSVIALHAGFSSVVDSSESAVIALGISLLESRAPEASSRSRSRSPAEIPGWFPGATSKFSASRITAAEPIRKLTIGVRNA